MLPEQPVALLNYGFALLGCFVVFGLCRVLGGSISDAALLSIAYLTRPVVALSMVELGSDLAGVGFLGLAYLLYFLRPDARLPWLLLVGAAAGLAYGFKPLHLVGAAFLGLVILIRPWLIPRKNLSAMRRSLADATVYTLGFLALAGVWLLRNTIELGNPIYPVYAAGLFDVLGWAGPPDIDYLTRDYTQRIWVPNAAAWLLYPWIEGNRSADHYNHNSGFGFVFVIGFPLAFILAAAYALGWLRLSRLSAEPRPRALWGISLLAMLFVTVIWWAAVDRQPRYLFAAILLGLPLFLALFHVLTGWRRQALRGLVLAGSLLMFAVLGGLQVIEFTSRILISGQTERHLFYEYPAAIDRLPPGSTVLNLADRPWNYPLLGAGHRNRVISPNAASLALSEAGEASLTEAILCQMGVSHVYTNGPMAASLDREITLTELDARRVNPVNQQVLANPRVLYRVNFSAESACDSKEGT